MLSIPRLRMKGWSPKNFFKVCIVRWLFTVVVVIAIILATTHETQNRSYEQREIPTISKVDNAQQSHKTPNTIQKKGSSSLNRGKETECLFQSIILQASSRYSVDPAIVKAIILAESGFNPRAVSKKGARGLMQLMPRTAEALGIEDSFHPEENINGGVKYFKKLLDRFDGDVRLALAAYNAGSRNVRKYQGVPPYKATRYYIRKVLKYYEHYKKEIA